MPSNHPILCHPLLLLSSIFPSTRVFSNESALRIRWPKYWSFSFNICHTNEHLGLIFFRMDWLDLLAVQGTHKSIDITLPTKICLIKPVNPKGNQSWIFIRRTNAEAETPILWPHDAKSQLSGKDSDAGKDWGQEEKGTIEDEMVEWHHQLNGHEFEQTPGDSEGQGRLVCCRPWHRRKLDKT